MPYQKSPSIDEDETAALLVPTITPLPTTTMDRRSSKTRIGIVAGMILLVVAGGGTVWMGDDGYGRDCQHECILNCIQQGLGLEECQPLCYDACH